MNPPSETAVANDDYDTPWKDAVTRYFPEFNELFGCRHYLEFPTVKLLDYQPQTQALLVDPNPFALVTAAHLSPSKPKATTGKGWLQNGG